MPYNEATMGCHQVVSTTGAGAVCMVPPKFVYW